AHPHRAARGPGHCTHGPDDVLRLHGRVHRVSDRRQSPALLRATDGFPAGHVHPRRGPVRAATHLLRRRLSYRHHRVRRRPAVPVLPAAKGQVVIEFDEVSKSYDGKRVLGPVSGTIASGGITALVGPNGAGKSTFLTIVGRLLSPTTGHVSV